MIKIGLDAGHGLHTAGKRTPDGIHEWELNDKVRDKVVNYLKDYDVSFVFTDNNEGEKDESLASRLSKYMNEGVNVFVSIHHNAYTGAWNNATGVEVFTDINNTEADMRLAKAIHKNLSKYTGLPDRGIKKENWWVINQNRIPAVLCEGGFMDGRKDYPVITSDKGQDGYARAVAEGIIEFLGLKKSNNNSNNNSNNSNNIGNNSYTVKVVCDVLNVRSGAGTDNKINTQVKKNEVYTIVEEKNDWGKLKSGAGWICLSYTEKTGTKTTKTTTVSYFKRYAGSSGSIVEALNNIGADSSFAYRKKIAAKNNIKNYSGTAAQNTQMLKLLKSGTLLKP